MAFKDAYQKVYGLEVPVPNPWHNQGYEVFQEPMIDAMKRLPTGQMNFGEENNRGKIWLNTDGTPTMQGQKGATLGNVPQGYFSGISGGGTLQGNANLFGGHAMRKQLSSYPTLWRPDMGDPLLGSLIKGAVLGGMTGGLGAAMGAPSLGGIAGSMARGAASGLMDVKK
jgi:hypothetical protein